MATSIPELVRILKDRAAQIKATGGPGLKAAPVRADSRSVPPALSSGERFFSGSTGSPESSAASGEERKMASIFRR